MWLSVFLLVFRWGIAGTKIWGGLVNASSKFELKGSRLEMQSWVQISGSIGSWYTTEGGSLNLTGNRIYCAGGRSNEKLEHSIVGEKFGWVFEINVLLAFLMGMCSLQKMTWTEEVLSWKEKHNSCCVKMENSNQQK